MSLGEPRCVTKHDHTSGHATTKPCHNQAIEVPSLALARLTISLSRPAECGTCRGLAARFALAPHPDAVYTLLYPVTRPPDPVHRLVPRPGAPQPWVGASYKRKPRLTWKSGRGFAGPRKSPLLRSRWDNADSRRVFRSPNESPAESDLGEAPRTTTEGGQSESVALTRLAVGCSRAAIRDPLIEHRAGPER